ncbi:MAG: hypothetical protein ACPH3N_07935 [Alcanivorax sediminis]|uniref:hypothetical protein n=1 Tax=Alcanivorax sediminis TaxID=2663008 RepID=UPI003C34E6D2
MITSNVLRQPLLHCALIGSLAFFVYGGIAEDTAPVRGEIHFSAADIDTLKTEWRQQLGRPLTPEEFAASLQAKVDERILIEEALARGWDRTDPIVRQRLRDNLAFTEHGHDDDADLLATAKALGMPLLDPVVRKRLLLRMQATLRSEAEVVPSDEQLARYAASAETTARRWHLSHVLRTGPSAESQLRALPHIAPEAAARHSEPFLAGNIFTDATDSSLAKAFGPGFVKQLEALPTRQWAGPVSSVFGEHLVWIEQRQTQRITVERDKAYLAWHAAQEHAALQRGLAALRQQYRVSWED